MWNRTKPKPKIPETEPNRTVATLTTSLGEGSAEAGDGMLPQQFQGGHVWAMPITSPESFLEGLSTCTLVDRLLHPGGPPFGESWSVTVLCLS